MRLASDLVANPGFFAGAPPGIVFADAFVEVTASGCMQRSHSADHRARFAYPFAFMPNVVPALFVGFLADVFRDDADASDKARLLQEYLGVSLLGIAARYQRALVLFGPGANGKSVLTAIAEASMPPGACCAIPPQDWANEYRLAMLAGKRLNVVAELPEADIMGAEAFKSVISGDPMTGRHIRQAPFTLRPVAGHIFAGNRLPGTNDQTHGFWRRFLVVSFNRTFALHEQTPKLAENLIATELPSIVSWCLEGAARVLAQGSYTIPASSAAAIEKWRKHADQVRAFIDEWTTTLPLDAEMRAWTKASDVYRAYRAWASENGHRPLASNTFGQRMDAIKLGSAHTENGNKYPVRIERPAMRTEGEP
jgi:putative DNA primase/helicase